VFTSVIESVDDDEVVSGCVEEVICYDGAVYQMELLQKQ
jgi:hypothetical protein